MPKTSSGDAILPTAIETKICSKCTIEKSLDDFHKQNVGRLGRHPRCKICRSEDAQERPYKARLITAEQQRINHLKYQFGLTPEDYDVMLEEQAGKCDICKSDNAGGRWNSFYIDHCHKTGMVRGLLCINCNMGLGKFKDNIEFLNTAIKYIQEYK